VNLRVDAEIHQKWEKYFKVTPSCILKGALCSLLGFFYGLLCNITFSVTIANVVWHRL